MLIIVLCKYLFSGAKLFYDICWTYDGLVSTVLSRLATASRDSFCETGIEIFSKYNFRYLHIKLLRILQQQKNNS